MSNEINNEDRPVSPEELLDYFHARLSAEREREIEELLARSDEYAEMARQVGLIGATLDQWTAKTHQQALEMAAQRQTTRQERLARLKTLVGDVIDGAVEIVMQAPEKSSRIVTELARHLTPAPVWRFAPAMRALGTEDEPVKYVKATGERPADFSISGETTISFSIDEGSPGEQPPLLHLIREEGDDLVLVAQAQPKRKRPDEPTLYADFNVAPGRYVAVLTPPRAQASS